jgi:hypothetical protein
MTKCDECKKQISRSGRGHTATCETARAIEEANSKAMEHAAEEMKNSTMPRPKFRMPKEKI